MGTSNEIEGVVQTNWRVRKKEIKKNQISHPFDIAFKVIMDLCPDIAFEYLNLPGKYVCQCKSNFTDKDSKKYFLDSLLLSNRKNASIFINFLINLEHQSSYVSLEKLKTINMYSVLASYYLGNPAISLVLTDVDSYNKSVKELKVDGHIIYKPEYFYFSMDEIFQKMDNLIKKHDLNQTLSDMEAMDVPFLPIMVPKHMRKDISKRLAILFSGLKIKNDRIVRLIVIVLNIMLEYFFEGDELSKLKEMLNMEVMEAVNSYHDQLNDVYGQINQYEQNLKLANEEVKLVNEEKNQLIEVIKNLKKQGKLTDEDLASAGLSI